MAKSLPLARQEVGPLVVRCVDAFGLALSRESIWRDMGIYLSRNGVRASRIAHSVQKLTQKKDAAQIIESIWREWDILNDRPLPEGVERVWSWSRGGLSQVVWKETRSPYYMWCPPD